jgi:hypothetical protein
VTLRAEMSRVGNKGSLEDVEAGFAASSEGLTSYRNYARYVSGVVWIDGVPWQLHQRVLMPLSMPHIPLEVDRAQLRGVMSEHRALLACWTTEWDRSDVSEWWWIACDQVDYDFEKLPSSDGRHSIRKGLRECRVRRVELGEFSVSAYPIYRMALEGYGQEPPSHELFIRNVRHLAEYPGTEFWGAFVGEEMAAFTICQVCDGAVNLTAGKSDPRLHKHKPNAALFYELTRHYLGAGLKYVTNGSRTLVHPTTINDFLEKLGFRKVYCRVDVELSTVAGLANALRVARWGRSLGLPRLLGESWKQVDSFETLMRIARSFQ